MTRAIVALASISLATLAAVLALMSRGTLTPDVGRGRRLRPLGPLLIRINAPRETVFDLIAVPYLSANPPAALRRKIEVLERGTDMVVAAHRTKVGRITAVTVESVKFSRPDEIAFRLLRGPVPLVSERFSLREEHGGRTTELQYTGELGTDLWALGHWWGNLVARYWERAVDEALASLKRSAEMVETRGASRAKPSAEAKA